MSEEFDQEDLAAFGVLDDLARGGSWDERDDTASIDPATASATDEAVEVLRRLYLESLGLLAYDLAPAQPRPETRAVLLANLIGDETQEVAPLRGGSATSLPASVAGASRVPPVSAVSDSGDSSGDVRNGDANGARVSEFRATPVRESQNARVRRSRWPLALAALFAFAAIGLGLWSAMLTSEVAYRDSQIRGLEARLADADLKGKELEAAKLELSQLEQRYVFVTAPAVAVYTMRPPAAGGLQPTARGHLFLAADRQHWQLEVRGLKPEPEPQDYQVWFIVDGLPLSGGVFDAKAGRPALLADNAMPAGTTAIAITLERKGGTSSPTSPILLIADSSVQI
ncbi:MAG: anti-sigma factor [Thermoanaerobaculia bacterium]